MIPRQGENADDRPAPVRPRAREPHAHEDQECAEEFARPPASSWLHLPASEIRRAARYVCLRLPVTSQDAYDAVVDALLKLDARNSPAEHPAALLATTAANLLRDKWARPRQEPVSTLSDPKRRSRSGLQSSEEMSVTHEHGTRAEFAREEETRWRSKAIEQVLARLPHQERELVICHYFQGVPLETIDRARGDKSGTSKSRLHRVREKLRWLMKSDPVAWRGIVESLEDPPPPEDRSMRGPGR